MDNAPKLTVFISSPGDVNEERVLAGRVIQRLNEEFFGILELVPIFWEHEPMLMSETFQTQLPLPSESDIFICVMWSKIGTRLPANVCRSDGSRYDSGTEFEFEDALQSFRDTKKPALLIYKKSAEPPFLRNSKAPDFQIKLHQKEKLDLFFKKWFQDDEGSFVAAFNPFDDLAQFEERLELHLRKLIARQVPVGALQAKTNIRWSKGSPFRGLSIFDTEHAAIFFGRTRAIGEIISALRQQAQDQQPFVMVLGMSGSGKSSLVRAGIIPLLTQAGVIEGVGLWKKILFRPSNLSGDVGFEIAKMLMMGMPIDQESCETCEQMIESISKTLKESYFQELINIIQHRLQLVAESQNLPENSNIKLLIIIDQMEEVFTTTYFDQRVRETFFKILQQLANSGLVWIIGTFRSDFYHRCAEIPALVKMIQGNGQYLLTPPSTNEIAQIVRLPTLAAGLFFEKHPQTNIGLDEVLIDEAIANSHNLALLQFILEQLYQHRREDGALTYQAYEMLGGLNGALAKRAEEVFNTCSPTAQAAFSPLMRTLVTFGEDLEKAVAGKRWLTSDASHDESELLEAFIQARLIVTDTIENQAVARITHECLLSHWPRLANWITQNQGLLRLRAHVADLASFWRGRGCSKELLLSDGKMLSDCEELLHEWANALPPLLVEFIRQSLHVAEQKLQTEQLRQRKKLRHSRQLTTAFAILTAVALYFTYDSFIQKGKANEALEQTEIRHQEIAALLSMQDTANNKPTQGIQRALNMLEPLHNKGQATSAMLDLEQAVYSGLSKIKQKALFIGHQKAINRVGVRVDNKRIISASEDGTAKLWTIDGDLIATLQHEPKNSVLRARFNHLGTQILTICEGDRMLYLWDGSTGEFIRKIETYINMFNTDKAEITEARFDLNDERIITAHEDGRVKMFSVEGTFLNSYKGHSDQVNGMWLDNIDEKQLLTFSDDKKVLLWDVENTQKPKFTWNTEGQIQTAAFSQDNQYVAAGDDNGDVYIWNRETGKKHYVFRASDKKRHTKVVHLAFQPKRNDNKIAKGLILSATYDDHSVWLWNTETRDIEYSFSQLGEVATHAVFSPDGKYLMAVSDSFIRRWDVDKGQLIQTFGGHEGDVRYAAYANNGEWIISAGSDNTVRLWSTSPVYSDFKMLAEHTNGVKKAVFSKNGKYLLSMSDDYSAKLWSTEKETMGQLISSPELGKNIEDVLFNPTEQSFAIASENTVKLWNMDGKFLIEFKGHTDKINRIKFSSDGKYLLTTSDDKTARIWNAQTGEELKQFKTDSNVQWANFTPDDKSVVTVPQEGQIMCWNVETNTSQYLSERLKNIHYATLSFDGQYVAALSNQSTTYLYPVEQDKNHTIELTGYHTDALTHIVFSQYQGSIPLVLTSSKDKTTHLWNANTGEHLQILDGHTAEVLFAAFSPKNRFIATAARDHTARVWRFNDASGKYETVGVLTNHTGTVTNVNFHPTEPFLVTTSTDQTIRFWPLFADRDSLIIKAKTFLPKHLKKSSF